MLKKLARLLGARRKPEGAPESGPPRTLIYPGVDENLDAINR
ncbi:MAG: hypothetical protein QME92_03330 [Bacillota bacterium]|nr:hypothetical protein [Bacillota bacterium]